MKNFTKFWFGLVALMVLPFSIIADIPVGTGTESSTHLPVSPYYGYSYSQVIYAQSDINATGIITSISWYFNGNSLVNSNDWTIYLGHTSKSKFSYTTDWIPVASLTQVWSGTFISPAVPGWVTIDIDDFSYNNIENLVIAVDENKPNYDGSSESFRTTNPYYNDRSLVYFDDYVNPDPSNPPAGVLELNYANIILGGISAPCPLPSNQMVSGITFNTATLDWTENGAATSWDIEYGPKGFWPGSGTLINTSVKPFLLEGLSQGNQYDWYITSHCENGLYSRSGPQSFATLCDAYSVPYFENFDGVSWPLTIPQCTTIENIDTYYTWEIASYSSYYSPPSSLQIYNGYTKDNDWFYTPGLQLTGGTSYLLQFKYTSSNLADIQKLEVKWGSDANSAFMVNGPIFNDANINYNGTFHDGIATFVPPSDAIYYLGFRAYSEPGNAYLFIDDVSVIPASTCLPPYDFMVTHITASSALFGWSDMGGGTSWNIEYGDAGFVQGTGTINNGIGNPYTLSNLEASHNYDCYVQADCGASQSSWVGPISFSTLCDALSVPYFENFDAASPPSLPPCMAMENVYKDWAYWQTSSWLAYSAPNNISIGSGYPELNDWFFLPGLQLTAGTTYLLEFMYSSYSSENERLGVNWGVEPNSASMTLGAIFNDPGFGFNGVYHKGTGVFTPTTTGTYYIGFHGYSVTNRYGIMIDDISVIPAPPCIYPVRLNATNITAESADLDWNELGSATSWNLEFGDAGFAPGTGTLESGITHPYHLNGLAGNHTYDFYVQADCGSEQSNWTGPVTFKTLCEAITVPYFENFDAVSPPALPGCMTLENPSGGYSGWRTGSSEPFSQPYDINIFADASLLDDWFFTPGLQLSGGIRYSVEAKYKGFGNTTEFEIKWGSAPHSVNMTEGPVFSDPDIHSINYSFFDGIGTFIPSLDGVYYIGFHVTSNRDFVSFDVDDVSISVSPACPAPANISITNITSGNAHLSWSELGDATSWNIEFGDTTHIPGTGMQISGVSNPTDLSGLSPFHSYDVYVQADCGSGQSAWSGPFRFNTLCEAIIAPYEEHFDTPSVPDCWQNDEYGDWRFANYVSYLGIYPVDHSGNDGYVACVDAATTYYSPFKTLLSPVFDISQMSNPQLRFFLYNNNFQTGTMDWHTLRVDLWNGTEWINSIYYWGPEMNIPEWVEVEIPLNSYSITGNIQFRFVVEQNNAMPYYDPMIIDDIYLEEIPLCPHPSNLIVKRTGANSADLDWTSNSGISDIDYGPRGHFPGTGTIISGVSSLYTLNSLTGNSDYIFYVRDHCPGGGYSNWAWFKPFTTLCDDSNMPYFENFDGPLTTENLPDCISTEDFNGDNAKWQASGYKPFSSPASMVVSNSYLPMDDWFFTQGLHLTGGISYLVEFKYTNSSSTSLEKLEVKWGTGPYSKDMVNGPVFTDENIQYYYVYQDGAGLFTPPSDGIYYIGFHGYSDPYQSEILVDDVSVKVTPDCLAPIALKTSDILTQSASLSWTEMGSASSWNIEYGDAGFMQGAGTLVTGITNSFTLAGLQPSHTYEYYVQADCGNERSAWRGPKAFTTACDLTTLPFKETFPTSFFPSCWSQTQEGSFYDNVWSASGTSHAGGLPSEMVAQYQYASGVSRLITPAFNTSGFSAVYLLFKHNYNENSYYGTPPVIKIQSSSDLVAWTDEWSTSSTISFCETRVVPITHNLGPNTYLAWVIDGDHTKFADWFVDNVQITDYPVGILLNIKVFLEGPVAGTQMTAGLNTIGAISLTQPYSVAPWLYEGTESLNAIINQNIVDWVLVELRDAPDVASATSATQIARQAGLLLRNGTIISANGNSPMQFSETVTQNLFVVVWHRNHLGVMSAIPLSKTCGVYTYNFSTGSDQAYGNGSAQKELLPGLWGMKSGDGNGNGLVEINDKTVIWKSQTGSSGYKSGDYDMNGQVTNADKNEIWLPNQGSGTFVPF